jgi:hypothetical protein
MERKRKADEGGRDKREGVVRPHERKSSKFKPPGDDIGYLKEQPCIQERPLPETQEIEGDDRKGDPVHRIFYTMTMVFISPCYAALIYSNEG